METEPLCSPAVQDLVHIWWHKAGWAGAELCKLAPAHTVTPNPRRGLPQKRASGWQTGGSASEEGPGLQDGSHLGSISQERLGEEEAPPVPLPLHHERVKISWHHLVSSHSARWRSSGNYTHLHVLIWLISRNKHFPMTQATWWATHLQKLW